MSLAAVCLATLCSIKTYNTDPELHGLETRIFMADQTIQQKMARSLYYERAVRILFDIKLNSLLGAYLTDSANQKLKELKQIVNHAKKTWRDAGFCYIEAEREMKELTEFHLNETMSLCIQQYINWVQADLNQANKIIINLADGQRQLKNVHPECLANTEKRLPECMKEAIEEIEKNINEIQDTSELFTTRGVESYLNSYHAFDKCLLQSKDTYFASLYEIYKKGENCSRSTHRPLCPYTP